MNELQERVDRLLDEPWLDRDLGAVDTKVAKVRARQRRLVAAGVGVLVVVLIAGAARRPDAGDGAATVQVADTTPPVYEQGDATMIVFLDPSVSPADEARFRAELAADGTVGQAWWIDREVAYQEFRCLFADQPQMIESVTAAILPPSFDVALVAGADGEAFRTRMRTKPGVSEVVVAPGPNEVENTGTSVPWRSAETGACGGAAPGEPIR